MKGEEDIYDVVAQYRKDHPIKSYPLSIQEKIIKDLTWLAEKSDDPIVKITYSMSISIVELHFGTLIKTNKK